MFWFLGAAFVAVILALVVLAWGYVLKNIGLVA